MLKNSKVVPFLIVSIAIHFAVLFFAAQKRVKPVFISTPIDVAFYNPADEQTDLHSVEQQPPSTEQQEPAKETKPEPQPEAKKQEQPKAVQSKNDEVKAAKPAPVIKDKAKVAETPKKMPEATQTKAQETAKTPPPAPVTRSQVQTVQVPASNAKYGVSGSQYENLSFDEKDFNYAYYERTIINKIGRFWEWAESFDRLRAVVYFRIFKDGEVDESSLRVVSPSGNHLFDENAREAILKASPFGELPQGYNGDSIGVYFEFKYK
ncbi:MAG: TonB C-terminal domain-containing protein [Elusimicrobiota bacterium]|jgi:TonB family protein|nr:TonB C-terminal domain-containing protein [Elusimicrobiota bacterium]